MKKHVGMESQKSNQTRYNDTTTLLRIAVPTSFAIFPITYTPQPPYMPHPYPQPMIAALHNTTSHYNLKKKQNHASLPGRDETGREPTCHENNQPTNLAAGEATKKVTGLWQIVVSICNIFLRISHGCYGRVKR